MLDHLPDRALSIRQPWCWAIVNAGKDIENRSRRVNYRGSICLHASLYQPKASDYDACLEVIRQIRGDSGTERGMTREQGCIASMHNSDEGRARGGIIGMAEIVDCVEYHESPWFEGPFGLVLANVQPVPFIELRGMLGLFNWKDRG